MFAPLDSWVWDFWVVDDGERYHLFFLFASVALRDPEARHRRASIGHAVSDDLSAWHRVEDALVRQDPPACDDLATWTGCVVRHPDGRWLLFYTAATLATPPGGGAPGIVQCVALATSPDLVRWERSPANPVLSADPRWYETFADGGDEPFRDPWVFRDGDVWRMLVTAKAKDGPRDDRGVIGTAVSADLEHWEAQPPLSAAGRGFGQLEVMETVRVGDDGFLLANCLTADLPATRQAAGDTGGVWVIPGRPCGWDPADAYLLAGQDRYVGRIVPRRGTGEQVFLAFRNEDADGRFVGGITDPVPVVVDGGRLRLLEDPVPAGA